MNKENENPIDMSDVPNTPMKEWYAELGKRMFNQPPTISSNEGETVEATNVKEGKTAEELFNTIPFLDRNGDFFNIQKSDVIDRMEAYASQFKTTNIQKVAKTPYEILDKEIEFANLDIKPNDYENVIDAMEQYGKQWQAGQSQHSYTEAEVLAIIEQVKGKLIEIGENENIRLIAINQLLPQNEDSVPEHRKNRSRVSVINWFKKSITDIDFKYLLK